MKKKKKAKSARVESKKVKSIGMSRAAQKTLESFAGLEPIAITPGALQRTFQSRQRASSKSRPASDACPIVGIGASTGGFDSLVKLLKFLPSRTGLAYVLIPHLPHNHEKISTKILSRATEMSVVEAKDNMAVKPNHVYVIPPDTNMGVVFGVLKLMPRPPSPARFRPVDFFLRSLSDDQTRLIIAVILSGADGDGAMGLRAIIEQGGITLVQDPATAAVDGMPHGAIAAGASDRVLSIRAIADELTGLGRVQANKGKAIIGSDQVSARELFRRLKRSFNVDFTKYKPTTVERRLRRRMLLHRVESLKDYLDTLAVTPDELTLLHRDFLVGTTSFFRDADVFEAFENLVLPGLLKGAVAEDPLRLWIAGCSTGEEAYSIAISTLEVRERLGSTRPIRIFASDINGDALEKAREGIYPESIATDVSSSRLERFFQKVTGGYRINASVRDLCVFASHNVTSDPPFSKIHGIFCRNLLMYLDPSVQRDVIKLFNYALTPGGSLILGQADVLGVTDQLETVDGRRKIYRRNNLSLRSYLRVPLAPRFQRDFKNWGAELDANETSGVDRMMTRVLLERFVPAGVLVNARMQIIRFRGGTSEFLEASPGAANFDLFQMAKGGLESELRSLMKKVVSSGFSKRADRVIMRKGRSRKQVALEIIPLRVFGEPIHYLILFDHTAGRTDASKIPGTDGRSSARRHLERELSTVTKHLQDMIREQEFAHSELQTAHEEVLCSNEELQATNEELQTAKEELQSANEGLTSMNLEILDRNAQLQAFSNELTNLLGSVNLPVVMVDQKLNVRRFTPGAEKLYNIVESDVGRPICQLRPKFDIPELSNLIRTSIDSSRNTEVEIRDVAGRSFSLRIRPFPTTADGRGSGGAVVVVADGQAKEPACG